MTSMEIASWQGYVCVRYHIYDARGKRYTTVELVVDAQPIAAELLVLMAHADDEAMQILANELEFSQRVKTTDVMFARFVDLLREPNEAAKVEFHNFMVDLAQHNIGRVTGGWGHSPRNYPLAVQA